MSTKIYDAYIMDTNSMKIFNEFIKEIKAECIKREQKRIFKLIADQITDMVDSIALSNQKNMPESLKYDKEKLICGYYEDYQKTISGLIREKEIIKDKDKIFHNIKNYNALYNILKMASEIVGNKMEIAEVDRSIMTLEYEVRNSIYIFPYKSKILFMVFGQTLQNLMYENISKEEWNDFVCKYKISDYHYQNQTDRPEHISKKEWNKRYKDWMEVMPTGVPRDTGMVINITGYDDFKNDMFFIKPEKIHTYLKSKDERVEQLAILAACYSEKDWHEINENLRKLKDNDKALTEKFNHYKAILSNIIPDITDEILESDLLDL